jgi:hypothetical protein
MGGEGDRTRRRSSIVSHTHMVNAMWLMQARMIGDGELLGTLDKAENKMKRMHVGEFLDKLAASPRTWRLTDHGEIRNAEDDCPHIYLDAYVARPFRGPGEITLSEMCDAADNEEWHKENVRRGLLEACGLTASMHNRGQVRQTQGRLDT